MKGVKDPLQPDAVPALQSYRHMLRNGYYKHPSKKKSLILKLLKLTSGPQRSYREWKRESVQSAAIWEFVQHHEQKAIPLCLCDSETASVWGNVWPWLGA